MEIEITKPTPEQASFQKLFERNEERMFKCLFEEIEELYAKVEALEKRAIKAEEDLQIWKDMYDHATETHHKDGRD